MKPIYPVSSSRRVPLLSAAAAYGMVIRCFNTKSDMYVIFYAGDANGVMEGEIRPQSQSSLCLQAYRRFPSCLHPDKTMFNLIRSSYHYVRKHVRIPLFTAQIHPNKTMFNLLRREMGKMRYHESLYHVGLGLIC
uniref:Uncharacterized protein n=1 Tax=Oryza meridionalis TaxID=40149 RepID=A0A0E0CIL8_9ORYZ